MKTVAVFEPGRKVDLKEASNRVKVWVRRLLSLPQDAVVTVSEINCRDVRCPGVETAILVMEAGKTTRLIKVPRPLTEIRMDDLDKALL